MNKSSGILTPLLVWLVLVAVGGVLISPPFSVSAETFRFNSEKPLFAKVAVNEESLKVLSVVFDESQGTGKGFDVLYADVNFDGKFEAAEKVTANVRKCSLGFHCEFPAVKLDVPYNEKAKGIRNACRVEFNYQRHSITPPPARRTVAGILRTAGQSAPAPSIQEDFGVSVTILLRQDSSEWQYSFRPSPPVGNVKPAESLEKAPVWSFNGAPKLNIDTQPDGRKPGNFGIELKLTAGETQVECRKEGGLAKAQVEIKEPDGKVVHRGDDTLDKFVFG